MMMITMTIQQIFLAVEILISVMRCLTDFHVRGYVSTLYVIIYTLLIIVTIIVTITINIRSGVNVLHHVT